MKQHVRQQLASAIEALRDDGTFVLDTSPDIPIERTRDPRHGDFASPVALGLARALKTKPREVAAHVVARLPESDHISRVEVAGPGFINFSLSSAAFQAVVGEIRAAGEAYGRCEVGNGTKVQVEFVSSNPTGPLHVGHGRNAACGAALANLLDKAGFEVQREYYLNDIGRQMEAFAVSVWVHYLDLHGEAVAFPAKGYQGDYVVDIARDLKSAAGDRYLVPASEGFPSAGPSEAEQESHLGALIDFARSRLGEACHQSLFEHARDAMVAEMRSDLEEFGVVFDRWYSEGEMKASGAVERVLQRLGEAGHCYEKDGARWFRSSDFGDEKDRVVVRENGVSTYFASDIAYHVEKFERGFDRVIDVWGADHHSHVARMKGALRALDYDADAFQIMLLQLVNLYRDGKRLQMSTRAGQFVTLRELREEVGRDAARFFYVMRKGEQHLDFDLDLATSQSSENPVYYLQYAHARICSVLEQARRRGIEAAAASPRLDRLVEPQEIAVMWTLSRYPEVIESAALACEPHQVAFYLRELATDFHGYYNAHTFLVEDGDLCAARLALALAVRQVLADGLALLGVSAPHSM